MPNPFRRWLAAPLLALIALHAQAEITPAVAEQLMRSSGLWLQLDGIAPQMRASLAEGVNGKGQRLKPAETERLLGNVDAIYAAERLRVAALQHVATHTDAAHVAPLQQWYGSRAGAAITRLEEAAANDARDPALVMRESATLLAAMPAPRQALLAEITTASRAAESTTNTVINSTVAIQAGLASASPEGPAVSTRELRSMLDAQRPQFMATFNTLSMAAFARIYAAVPDADLQAYLAFLKSPAGEAYNAVCVQAVDAALVEAGQALGRGMPGIKDAANT